MSLFVWTVLAAHCVTAGTQVLPPGCEFVVQSAANFGELVMVHLQQLEFRPLNLGMEVSGRWG